MTDNSDRWLKKQEEADLDYKNGFAAGLDNDPGGSSESPDWKRGRGDGEGWAKANINLRNKEATVMSRGFSLANRELPIHNFGYGN